MLRRMHIPAPLLVLLLHSPGISLQRPCSTVSRFRRSPSQAGEQGCQLSGTLSRLRLGPFVKGLLAQVTLRSARLTVFADIVVGHRVLAPTLRRHLVDDQGIGELFGFEAPRRQARLDPDALWARHRRSRSRERRTRTPVQGCRSCNASRIRGRMRGNSPRTRSVAG